MADPKNVKIIAFVGLSGSGKSTAVKYISEKQIPRVYFGSVIIDAISEAGIDVNPENEQIMREQLRKDHGDDVVVNRIIEQINNLIDAGQKRIIADGLFTLDEYKILKRTFPRELTVIAIVAPKRTRYHRLTNRDKRAMTEKEASDNDWSSVERLGRGAPIAMADAYIINDGSLESLYAMIDEKLDQMEFLA